MHTQCAQSSRLPLDIEADILRRHLPDELGLGQELEVEGLSSLGRVDLSQSYVHT